MKGRRTIARRDAETQRRGEERRTRSGEIGERSEGRGESEGEQGMRANESSGMIVDVASAIDPGLGPGLLESVSEATMVDELKRRGLAVETQQGIPVIDDDEKFDLDFRADLIVDRLVLIELKSIEEVAPVHRMQLLTDLRLTGLRLGLLLNFNVALNKDGITRVVNGLHEPLSSPSFLLLSRLCVSARGPSPCPPPAKPSPTSATFSATAASPPTVGTAKIS
ncbi:GxxExxY protein [Tautonia rosea]|uniref:GxxExxY protein n=1 Tax=Tautonia rosea TaxID=2728037 RepID=UPI0036F26FB7